MEGRCDRDRSCSIGTDGYISTTVGRSVIFIGGFKSPDCSGVEEGTGDGQGRQQLELLRDLAY